MTERTRKVFIASSVEGIQVAESLFLNFEYSPWQAEMWTHVDFRLSQTTLDSLQTFVEQYDYGIFVLTPDDELRKRGVKEAAPRDNVLFELGLFIGRLGKERTFFVKPRGYQLHLPTDLSGITPAEYTLPADGVVNQAHLAAAFSKIRNALKAFEKKELRDSRIVLRAFHANPSGAYSKRSDR